jgi:digeranylgeranylglycerophospholipid reductase
MKYDVCVVGAGPVGSRVAFRLAAAGYRAIVLERKRRLDDPVCCTGIISRECAREFDIDRSVILQESGSARFFSPSGKLLHLGRAEPLACIVDRPALNASMARQAQAIGVEYVLNCGVKNVEVQHDRVRIKAEREGNQVVFEARAVVVAAGSASRLAAGLGLGKVDDFAMGAQAVVDTRGIDEVEVYLGRQVAPAFFGWLVPTSPGRALVGLMSRRRSAFYLRRLIDSLAVQGKIASADVELSIAPVPLKPLPRTYSDRIVVVGGAAGQAKPTTGGGIYYGLLCADAAANTLRESLSRDDLSSKHLAGYQRAWQRRLGQELKVGYWSRVFYEKLSDARVDQAFDIITSSGIGKSIVESEELSFDWHGMIVLKLLGHGAFSGIVRAARVPFPVLRNRT